MITINRSSFQIVHRYNNSTGGSLAPPTKLPVYKKSSTNGMAAPIYSVRGFYLNYLIDSINFGTNKPGANHLMYGTAVGSTSIFNDADIAPAITCPLNIQSVTYTLSNPTLVESVPYSQFVAGCSSDMMCLWMKEYNATAIALNQSLGTFKITILTDENVVVNSPIIDLCAAEAYTITTQPPTSPTAPSGLYAQYQTTPTTRVSLVWADQSTNETNFLIKRRVNGGAWSTLAYTQPNISYYYDTNISSGNVYTYQVQAINSAGSSAFSTSNSVTI